MAKRLWSEKNVARWNILEILSTCNYFKFHLLPSDCFKASVLAIRSGHARWSAHSSRMTIKIWWQCWQMSSQWHGISMIGRVESWVFLFQYSVIVGTRRTRGELEATLRSSEGLCNFSSLSAPSVWFRWHLPILLKNAGNTYFTFVLCIIT